MMADLAADAQAARGGGGEAAARAGAAGWVVERAAGARRDLPRRPDLGGLFLRDGAWVFVLGSVAPDRRFLLAHQRDVGGGGRVGGAGGGGAGHAGGGDVGGVAGRVEGVVVVVVGGVVGGVGGGGGGLGGGAARGEEGVVVAARCGGGGGGGGGGGWWCLWEGFVGRGDSRREGGVGCGGGGLGRWLVGGISRGRGGGLIVVVVHGVCGVGCIVRMDLGEGSKVAVLATRVGDGDGFAVGILEVWKIDHVHFGWR